MSPYEYESTVNHRNITDSPNISEQILSLSHITLFVDARHKKSVVYRDESYEFIVDSGNNYQTRKLSTELFILGMKNQEQKFYFITNNFDRGQDQSHSNVNKVNASGARIR